jgi:aromatic ring hydroxylase
MQAVANNPEFANKVGVKQSIGREFTKEKNMNTKRMNRLEELGRVDNEKAYTRKGKDNLMAEKRVVGELKAKTGGMLARTGGSSALMNAKGKKMMGGGKVKAYKKGGSVGSASKRADGIAQRGHTRGRIV